MSYFLPTRNEVAKKLYDTAENSGSPDIDPGVVGGFIDNIIAPINGAYNGVVGKPSLILADAGVELGKSIDYWTGLNTTPFFEQSREDNKKQVESLIPNPKTSAVTTQMLYSFSEMAGQAIVGNRIAGPLGSAVGVGTLQGYSDYTDSVANGIDPATAADKAFVTGLGTAFGVTVPMTFGLRLSPAARALANEMSGISKWAMKSSAVTTDLVATTGANVSAGMAIRGFSHDILESNGYSEIAQQYKALDDQALAIDAVIGLAFGALGQYANSRVRVPQDVIDAALHGNNGVHAETSAAPGVPINTLTRDAHIKALRKAVTAVINGEKVDITSEIKNAEFMPKGDIGYLQQITEAIKEAYPDMPMYYTRDGVGIPLDYLDVLHQRFSGDASRLLTSEEQTRLRNEIQDIEYKLDFAKKELNQARSPVEGSRIKGRKKAQVRKIINDEHQRLLDTVDSLERRLSEQQALLSDSTEGGKYFDAHFNLSQLSQGILPEGLISLDEVNAFMRDSGMVDESPLFTEGIENTDVKLAENVIAETPDLFITTLDDQGKEVRARASDLLKQVDDEISSIKQDSKLYDIAAACLFRKG